MTSGRVRWYAARMGRTLFDEVPAAGGEGPGDGEPVGPQVWSVGELTRELRDTLQALGRVSVEGEVSRVVRAASGHMYLDLKDEQAKISATIWRSAVRSALRFDLEEGMQVVAHGELDVYAPRGTYSLNVRRIELAGMGALLAKFEQLKQALSEKGWFERARPLPPLPKTIGVVTSRDGAAFRDFLRTRSLRWPGYPVRLAHTSVQGPGSAASIADAIRRMDASGVDVIVVCRGGGSLEDLWAFNELPVAEAIWATSVPVVSGVGHETDLTLSDLVADLRAHTPTDAAQTVIPDRHALTDELERLTNHLAQGVDGLVRNREERLQRLVSSRVLRDGTRILTDRARSLADLGVRLGAASRRTVEGAGARLGELHPRLQARSPERLLASRAARLQAAALRLGPAVDRAVVGREQDLRVAASQLDALSPLKILGRGYSITTRADDGAPLTAAGEVKPGDRLRSRLHSGSVLSEVVEVDRSVAGSAEGG